VSLSVALLLVVAAAAKAYPLLVASGAGVANPFPSGAIAVTLVSGELALAAWLASGRSPGMARQVSLLAFGGFLGVSLHHALAGRATCGCFGPVPVPPWATAALDAAVVLALVAWRPQAPSSEDRPSRGRPPIGPALVGVILTGAVGFGAAALAPAGLTGSGGQGGTRSVTAATTQPGGSETERTILVTPLADGSFAADIGFVAPGASGTYLLTVTRPWGPRAATVAAVNAECTCTQVRRFTRQVDAGGTLEIEVGFAAPPDVSNYSKKLTVSAADPSLPPLVLHVRARVGLPLAMPAGPIRLRPQADGADGREGAFIITNDGPAPVRLLYATCDAAGCYAIVPRAAVGSHSSVEVPVRQHGGTSVGGPREAVLEVHTDCETQPSLKIRVAVP
jgi:hypothetical protein